MSETYSGGCLCGQVRYVANGQPLNVRVCHCRTCQKVTGQPMWARAMWPDAALEISGEVTTYATSDALDRGFCPACGTTLFSFRSAVGATSIVLASLDEPAAFTPTMQIWTSRKLPWVVIEAGMEQHAEGPPG